MTAELAAGRRVGTHRVGEPVPWLGRDEGRAWWARMRPHTQSADAAATEDADGLTYAAALWADSQDRLLLFEILC